jgi:hypothetical protein
MKLRLLSMNVSRAALQETDTIKGVYPALKEAY